MAEDERLQAKADDEADDGEAPKKEGKLRWVIGWVVVPGSLLMMLFLAGVHVGANYPEMWLSRLIGWLGA